MRTSLSKRITLVVSLLLLCSFTLFSAPVAEMQKAAESFTVIDMRGRAVEVPRTINSIIATEAGALRMLSYFDAIDKVIAVEDVGTGQEKTYNQFFPLATYRLAFPHLRELPSIGSSANHEGIIAANPDILFSTTVDVSQLDQLQAILQIPVFAINADVELNDLALTYGQLRTVGRVLGEKQRAEALVTGIQAHLDELAQRTAGVGEMKRAYAGGMMFYGPADLLRTTGDYDSFDLVRVENVMSTNPTGNLQPFLTSIETLIKENPEYVFIDAANEKLSQAGYNEQKRILDAQVEAFTKRNVFSTLVYKYYGTNWESPLINAYFVGKTIYPELFADIDVKAKAEEIWRLFFQTDLDFETIVKEQGSALQQVAWF